MADVSNAEKDCKFPTNMLMKRKFILTKNGEMVVENHEAIIKDIKHVEVGKTYIIVDSYPEPKEGTLYMEFKITKEAFLNTGLSLYTVSKIPTLAVEVDETGNMVKYDLSHNTVYPPPYLGF